MNNKRKNRGGPVRNPRARSVLAEGVYNNAHFMHSATLQIGNVVRIKTASGVVWEGVFKTFSSNFDVVLEVAAKVDNPNTASQTLLAESFVDKLIFKSGDISTMEARDVDLEYPTKDTFQTDTAISARLNGNSNKSEEKELEPWDPSSGLNGGSDNTPLELENANGWDANDMFRKNEQEYGVTSTFDQSLKGYTVPLRTVDSADYREAEAKANQIASEIENQPQYKARLELENGDEETVFAAVVRPNQQEPNDKYIPPAKRKNQNSGKLVRSTPPPSQGSTQTTPSPKGTGAPPPMTYPNHPSPHAPPAAVPNNVHPMHNAGNPPPPHLPPPSINVPQHPIPNHGRPHSHTPPHGYNNQTMQRQGPPMNQNKAQMNGEAKPMQQRPPRAVYPGNNPPNVPPQAYQQEQPAKLPPPQQETMNHPRHPRDETIKELHGFSQDFKLPPPVPPSEQPPPPALQGQVPMEQIAAPQALNQQSKPPPQQATPPQQPQQSISPQQDSVEKVTNNFKKSTLNPNAKEFVLNPAAKPFQPRSPSTPSASRPHTPQTPSHSPYIPATVSGPVGQAHMPVMMPLGYMMTSQPQYQPQPQSSRMRKIPMGQMRTDVTSQMQVAAATGQPLLAPPLQQFVYPPGINPQGYPQMHALRMYDTPPQIQYLPPNPSNTPSPAQPPQYTQGQGPQAPPQQYQAAPPPQSHHQFPPIMHILPQPHMMQNMQYLQQPPPPQHHIPVMLPPQHPQAQQHGPAP
jgi:hypothetical protein